MKNTIKAGILAVTLLAFAGCDPAKKPDSKTDSTTTTVKIDSSVKVSTDTTKIDTVKKDTSKK
jgi:hypothetical protein